MIKCSLTYKVQKGNENRVWIEILILEVMNRWRRGINWIRLCRNCWIRVFKVRGRAIQNGSVLPVPPSWIKVPNGPKKTLNNLPEWVQRRGWIYLGRKVGEGTWMIKKIVWEQNKYHLTIQSFTTLLTISFIY